MSDTREKLIEILISHPDIGMTDTVAEMIADYLIDNGVTFATDNFVGDKLTPTADRWIPVSERLPEKEDFYIVFMHEPGVEEPFVWHGYYKPSEGWEVRDVYGDLFDGNPTHWMPLPAPPKEG